MRSFLAGLLVGALGVVGSVYYWGSLQIASLELSRGNTDSAKEFELAADLTETSAFIMATDGNSGANNVPPYAGTEWANDHGDKLIFTSGDGWSGIIRGTLTPSDDPSSVWNGCEVSESYEFYGAVNFTHVSWTVRQQNAPIGCDKIVSWAGQLSGSGMDSELDVRWLSISENMITSEEAGTDVFYVTNMRGE